MRQQRSLRGFRIAWEDCAAASLHQRFGELPESGCALVLFPPLESLVRNSQIFQVVSELPENAEVDGDVLIERLHLLDKIEQAEK